MDYIFTVVKKKIVIHCSGLKIFLLYILSCVFVSWKQKTEYTLFAGKWELNSRCFSSEPSLLSVFPF